MVGFWFPFKPTRQGYHEQKKEKEKQLHTHEHSLVDHAKPTANQKLLRLRTIPGFRAGQSEGPKQDTRGHPTYRRNQETLQVSSTRGLGDVFIREFLGDGFLELGRL